MCACHVLLCSLAVPPLSLSLFCDSDSLRTALGVNLCGFLWDFRCCSHVVVGLCWIWNCACVCLCVLVCLCVGAALGVCAKMRVLNYTKCICARLNRPMIYFGSGIGGIRMMNLCLERRVCDVFVWYLWNVDRIVDRTFINRDLKLNWIDFFAEDSI